jgi:hypothetical protein
MIEKLRNTLNKLWVNAGMDGIGIKSNCKTVYTYIDKPKYIRL